MGFGINLLRGLATVGQGTAQALAQKQMMQSAKKKQVTPCTPCAARARLEAARAHAKAFKR